MRWWPASAIVAVLLIEARSLVDTPSLTEELQKTPGADSVNYVDDRVLDLYVGYGFTVLGLAFVAVFVAGLVHSVTRTAPQSFAAPLIAIGGGATVAATFIGYPY